MKNAKRSEDDDVTNALKKLSFKNLKDFDRINEAKKRDYQDLKHTNEYFHDKFDKNREMRQIFQKKGYDEAKDILDELIMHYQKIEYKIPTFDFENHNIFDETGLIMTEQEIETFVKRYGIPEKWYLDKKYLCLLESLCKKKIAENNTKFSIKSIPKEAAAELNFETEVTGVPQSEFEFSDIFNPPEPDIITNVLLKQIEENEEYVNRIKNHLELQTSMETLFNSQYFKYNSFNRNRKWSFSSNRRSWYWWKY